MPILAFLAMHVSVCLLITTSCSAVFARFGWLNWFGTADRSVFCLRGYFSCSRTYPAAWPNPSARHAEMLCVALVGRRFFCVCDCLRLFCCAWRAPHRSYLGLLVWRIPFSILSCRSDKLSVDGVLPVVVFIRFLRCRAAIFAFFLTDCCVLFRLLAHFWLCFCLFSLGFFVFSSIFADFCCAWYGLSVFCNKC